MRFTSVRLLAFVLVACTMQASAQEGTSKPRESAADSLGDPLPDAALLRLGTLRFRHPSCACDMQLSPDDTTVVTVGRQELIVWDVASGKEKWRVDTGRHGLINLPAASYGLRAIAFTADSQCFFTPGSGTSVVRWDVKSGEYEEVTIPAKAPILNQGRCRAIDVTKDGKRIAIGNGAGLVICNQDGYRLFEIENKPEKRMQIFGGDDRLKFGGDFSFVRFSPNEKLVAAVTSDSPDVIKLLDSETGQELRRIALKAWLVRLDFSPDSNRIVTTERDIAVRLYDVESSERLWSQVLKLDNPFENYTSAVDFAPDGQSIAAAATDNCIYLLEPQTGEQMAKLKGHAGYPWAVCFSSDSRTLFSAGWDGPIRRWDLNKRKQLPLPQGVIGSAVAAASPVDPWLAYVDDAGTIRLVSSTGGKELGTLTLPDTEYTQLLFSPDGRQLAGGGNFGELVHVAVWDVGSRQLLHRWDWPKGRDPHSHIECLSFTPDGKRLAGAVFRQHSAFIWDLTSGEQVASVKHKSVYGLSFSPDGQTLATAGWDSAVRFWDASNGAVLREHTVEKNADDNGRDDVRMYTVCYSPNGDEIATAHLSGDVRVWKAANMKLLRNFEVPGRFIYGAMCYSPDGLWLATGAMGGKVSLWDPQTGQIVWDKGKHQSHVYTVSFGSDGRTLVTGSDDGLGYLWDLSPMRPAGAADLEQWIGDLSAQDSQVAYTAMWGLATVPDRVVGLLAGLTSELNESPADTAKAEPITVARRATALLAQVGTPQARLLLKGWSSQDPDSPLSRAAAESLQRIK
jgi:WD40 repeat protein